MISRDCGQRRPVDGLGRDPLLDVGAVHAEAALFADSRFPPRAIDLRSALGVEAFDSEDGDVAVFRVDPRAYPALSVLDAMAATDGRCASRAAALRGPCR